MMITEDDLTRLEQVLPQWQNDLMPLMADGHPCAGRLRTQVRQVQAILLNVRWNYGPFRGVERIDAQEPPTTEK